jgi:ribonuclease D
MKIADLKTTDLAYMERNKILSRKQITMYGKALVEAIESAFGIPEDRLPRYPHKRSPVLKTAVRKRIKALKAWRDAKALELRLDPGIVCSKALIAAIAQNNPETESALCHIKEMRTWQRGTFGKEIVEVLNP